jgi:hypothetical protein
VKKRVWIVAFVCLLLAVPALAGGFELTPTIGYRSGGDFSHLSFNGEPAEFSLDDGEEYGLIATFPITHRLDFEFRWTHQGTDLSPTQVHAVGPNHVSTDSYLGGLVFFIPVDSKVVRPFLNVEIGATQFDVNEGFTGEAGFAYALGGGSKFYLGDHFGLRVQGSYLSGNIPGGHDVFCSADGCYSGTSRNSVGQFELTGGVIFRF